MLRPTMLTSALVLAGCAYAQTSWLPAEPEAFLGRGAHGVAWDEDRDRLVLHGPVDDPARTPSTLEWEAGTWFPHFPSRQPDGNTTSPTRTSLAYFAPRRRTMAFSPGEEGVLWEWDGEEWERLRNTIPSPPPWREHVLVHEAGHGRLLLFGGRLGDTYSNATWTWNGTSWTEHSPPLSPLPRANAAMVHDPNRDRVLLFGGANAGGDLGDTWEWDGARWIKLHVSSAPRARWGHSLTYDPRTRLVFLFGGSNSDGECFDDTWAWNGERWSSLHTVRHPVGRRDHAMAFLESSDEMLLIGGFDEAGRALRDCWTFDGNVWRRCRESRPSVRAHARMAFDPKRALGVLYGEERANDGAAATWLWDGRWQRIQGAGPGRPQGHALAFDAVRQEVLFFGTAWDEGDATWTFDGGRWSNRRPKRSPPSRTFHAMGTDERTGHVILFGGRGTTGARLRDTWEWDGFDWSQRFPVHVPEARAEHALSFDGALGGLVLSPGDGSSTTYLWNGNDWVTLAALPRSVRGANLAYDAHRRRTILFGGISPLGRISNETWELTRRGWNEERTHGPAPPARFGHAMLYDAVRRRILVFGGASGRHGERVLDDAWWLRPVRDAKLYAFGESCEGKIGLPILSPVGDDVPWVGESFRIEVSPFVPPAMLVLGADRGNIDRGTKLPLDLSFLGLEGCDLLVEPLIFVPLSNRIHSFDIPARPTLIGSFFYQQAIVSDPTANGVRAVLSQGLVGRVGSK
ncbi:MAG: hypothetical protein H6834_17755 [Planctomycetes bacterium]|nr:hypothetical protein [Planctomycetota bacterium]